MQSKVLGIVGSAVASSIAVAIWLWLLVATYDDLGDSVRFAEILVGFAFVFSGVFIGWAAGYWRSEVRQGRGGFWEWT